MNDTARIKGAATLALLTLLVAALTACTTTRRSPTPPTAIRTAAATVPSKTRPSDSELLALPDAVPHDEPRSALGNPPFYEVFGQR